MNTKLEEMKMLNQIIIMGRLTRDPELRYTPNQVPVCSFRIACDRDFPKSKDSNEHETDFVDVVAWRGTGEFVSKYFAKGRMVIVKGRLQIRPWTDQEGNKRSTTEIVADGVYFGDSKSKEDAGGNRSAAGGSTGAQESGNNAAAGFPDTFVPDWNESDGDLPF